MSLIAFSYPMVCLRPLESDVYRLQIPTYKDGPRIESVNTIRITACSHVLLFVHTTHTAVQRQTAVAAYL